MDQHARSLIQNIILMRRSRLLCKEYLDKTKPKQSSHQLKGNVNGSRLWLNSRKGVGKDSANGDGRIGKNGRGGEKVPTSHPQAHHGRDGLFIARSNATVNDQ